MPDIGTPGPPTAGAPPLNLWASVNQFYSRGGFVNGLNPTVVGRVWYVSGEQGTVNEGNSGVPSLFTQGSDSNSGLSPKSPLATIARALALVDNYDIIVISGVFREQVVAPTGVFDVTIIGAANRPRQATTSGTATGGGATWLAPASPTALTPLLELNRQGWSIRNIMFAPTTSSAAIHLTRSASVDLIDASHTTIADCYFAQGGTGSIGIEDANGAGFVLVERCRFFGMTGTAILSLATGAAVPLRWQIRDCVFGENTNDIKMSLSYAVIERNQFLTAGSGATNKVISTTFISVQGGNNHITLNQFSNTEGQIAPGNGYTGAASDTWMNYVNDQAALAFGQPA